MTTAATVPSIVVELVGMAAWLLDMRSGGACLDCFRLWQGNDWTRAVENAEEADREAAPTPLAAACIAAQVTSFAAGAPLGSLGASRLREVKLHNGETVDRILMRHPACGACLPLASFDVEDALRNADDAPLRAVALWELEAGPLAVAVDDAIGLVRRIAYDELNPIASGATATLHAAGSPLSAGYGYGRSGRRKDDPALAAIEAIERFAGETPCGRTDIVASYEQLGDRAVDPAAFILHDPSQADEPGYALQRYDHSLRYGWTRAYSFRRDASVLVPTQLAYYAADTGIGRTDGHFVYEVSNGCAAGSSIAEATLFGLLEVIERDAFLTSWHSGRKLRAFDASQSADSTARAIYARLLAEGLQVAVLDIGCGLPGTSIAVAVHDPDRRFDASLTCTAAAHIDPDRALRAALHEAATMKRRSAPEQRDARDARARTLLSDPHLVRDMDDHFVQGWPPEGGQAKSFKRHDATLPWHELPRTPIDVESVPRLLADYVFKALEHATDMLVVDQSIAPLAARGLHCVKVLAPGLLPMTFGHAHRRLDWSRISRFADDAALMRDDPHIFP